MKMKSDDLITGLTMLAGAVFSVSGRCHHDAVCSWLGLVVFAFWAFIFVFDQSAPA